MPVEIQTEPIVKEVRIAASRETVWDFFTAPEKMTRWLCAAATVDPRPGGSYEQTHISDDGTEHHLSSRFVEFEPPHRLVFSWTFTVGTPEEKALTSSYVEVMLAPDGDGTLVRLVHRDIPQGLWHDHDRGWTTLFGRLEAVFAT